MDTTGVELTVTVVAAEVDVHPFAPVVATVKLPDDVAVIEEEVAPVDHNKSVDTRALPIPTASISFQSPTAGELMAKRIAETLNEVNGKVICSILAESPE